MADAVTTAHIEAQARLRTITVAGVEQAWRILPNYDEESVAPWLSLVLPLLAAAQRQSVSLASAYVARMLNRRPTGVDAAGVIREIRGAVEPREVYRRPFVMVWSDLSAGRPWEDAVEAGLSRASASAALDVQMAHRGGLQAVQARDPTIRGWRRAADADACDFCRMIDGAKVHRADAMPLHARCGCGLEPLTDPVTPDPVPDGVAVFEHGEYGPTLGDPVHQHLTPTQAQAR